MTTVYNEVGLADLRTLYVYATVLALLLPCLSALF